MDAGLKEVLSRPRIGVSATVGGATMVALWHMAQRNGIGTATQARILLRQALARTLDTPDVQADVKEYQAYRTRRQWLADQADTAEGLSVEAQDQG